MLLVIVCPFTTAAPIAKPLSSKSKQFLQPLLLFWLHWADTHDRVLQQGRATHVMTLGTGWYLDGRITDSADLQSYILNHRVAQFANDAFPATETRKNNVK